MKLAVRMLMVAFMMGGALTVTAQTTEKAPKAPKAAKVKKSKKSKADAAITAPMEVAAPAPVATPAPVAVPAPAADGTTPAVDPVTGQPVPQVPLTTISFAEVNYDFGKIKEGDVVKHKFVFTNTGTNDMILENVKPSCGCTAIDWPRDPIAPGKSASIEAQFNSAGKAGPQTKYITITLNTAEHLERITFTGEVIPKPVDPATQSPSPAPGH